MRSTLISLCLAMGLAFAGRADPALRWDASRSNEIALVRGGADVWRFHFDPAASTKPFFDPVCVAGGPSLTWASPPDHRWHYGLWFSWKYLNGLNYWEEKAGRSEGLTEWSAPRIATHGDGRAEIGMDLAYRPGAGAAAVLTERRTVAVSAPDADGAYHLDWTLAFAAGDAAVTLDRTPLPGEPNGKSWGGYAGLSVRFAPAFSNVETVASTVGRVPRDAAGRLDVSAPAAEQNGLVAGRPYGVALLAHPANPRAPGDWYPIENPAAPFHYLNAAFLLKGALTLQPHEALTLRYRVCVHPGRWDADALRRASERYAGDPDAARPIRVLILTGANNHAWRETTAALKDAFAAAPRFAVAVNEQPWTMAPSDLDGVDLVLSNWNTFGLKDGERQAREWGPAMRDAFLAWVRRGGGFVVVHAGGCLFYDSDAFQSLTGGAWEKETFHPKRQTFTVRVADKEHPAMRGLSDFATFDEPWQHIANRNPARRVLASGVVGRESGGSGEPEPFAFTTAFGEGRCFNLVLGHDAEALANPGFRALLLRGVEWAATGDAR